MTSIVYSRSETGVGNALLGELTALGFELIERDPNGSIHTAAAARLMFPHPDFHRLYEEYRADPRPTLVLVDSDVAEVNVLDMLRSGDDVCHISTSAPIVALRIGRVLAREGGQSADNVDALIEAWRKSLPGDLVAGIMTIDLDHFLPINERFGLDGGNKVLDEVMARLQVACGPNDRLVRRHGDDIYLLLARPDRASLIADAAFARERIGAKPIVVGGESIVVTGSAGVAFFQAAGTGRVVRQAWLAMEMAKYNGRNDFLLFDSIRDANEDALTGVHSRRYFDMRLQRELTRALAGGQPLCLAMLDLDDFGQVNKTYGHPTGDEVLIQFAKLVIDSIRPSDWLARWGGEEFCLVMQADQAGAMRVAERIRARVAEAELHGANGEVLNITVSVGVAMATSAAPTVKEFVHHASLANRHAKEAGKNCVRQFDVPLAPIET